MNILRMKNLIFQFRIEGKAVIRKTVPDSITSWVISAFTINSVQGFGLIEAPRKVRLFLRLEN